MAQSWRIPPSTAIERVLATPDEDLLELPLTHLDLAL
jgi:hypothetical protein